VKIRGFRIETTEIEHALLRCADITSAIVLRAELETGPCLAAYIVASVPSTRRAGGGLREILPAYMVPDHIIEVPRIPLNGQQQSGPGGAPPVTLGPADGTGGSAPETGLQANVAQAWSTVLVVPVTGKLLRAGGHSLLVPRADRGGSAAARPRGPARL